MRSTGVRRRLLPVAAVAGAVMIAGGVAYATIPGAGGVITGCYSVTTGALRVIDADRSSCRAGEQRLPWNQTGPPGPPGPAGPQGPQGPAGVSGSEMLVEFSDLDSTDTKTVTLDCPDGKKLTGGGAAVVGGGSSVALTQSYAAFDDEWEARATEVTPYGSNWYLAVQALCADVGP